MEIIWLTQALEDLQTIINYISIDSLQTALDIINTIDQRANLLRIDPYLGRSGRVKNTRELIIGNLLYIIVYDIKRTKYVYLQFYTQLLHGLKSFK